jgi:hypothetical protein
MKKLATFQQLRTFDKETHPVDLEPGQFAINISPDNLNPENNDYNTFLYIGNGSSLRIDEGGLVLVENGTEGKGWIRYRLRNVSPEGDSVYGNLTISGANLAFQARGNKKAELIVPKLANSPELGSQVGSVRWNNTRSIFEAWDGVKWDTTSKVTVSDVAPSNPSNGDMWFDSGATTNLYIYVSTPYLSPRWVVVSSGLVETALQPGNGVIPNSANQINIIDQGSF